jgi:hypothetical protein
LVLIRANKISIIFSSGYPFVLVEFCPPFGGIGFLRLLFSKKNASNIMGSLMPNEIFSYSKYSPSCMKFLFPPTSTIICEIVKDMEEEKLINNYHYGHLYKAKRYYHVVIEFLDIDIKTINHKTFPFDFSGFDYSGSLYEISLLVPRLNKRYKTQLSLSFYLYRCPNGSYYPLPIPGFVYPKVNIRNQIAIWNYFNNFLTNVKPLPDSMIR